MSTATSDGDGAPGPPPAPAPASSPPAPPPPDTANNEFVEYVTPPEGSARGPAGTSVVTTEPFNPEKWREVTRAGLAVFLAVLLGVVILVFGIAGINGYPSDEAKEYLGIVFTPLVGLVGAATGFYYGGKDNN